MAQSRIPVRYAKALYTLAKEKNLLDTVKADIEYIFAACAVPEMKNIIDSPVIKTTAKEQAISAIFENNISPLALDFVRLVVKNKREGYLPDVARFFIDLYKKESGIKTVTYTSATAIDSNTRNKIIDLISKSFNAKVELHEKVDPTLIGGFVIRIDDLQYDASVSSKLKDIEKELVQSQIR